jgi:DNA-binding CsgD family transcriptional regulator/PAS domain-containing protein
MSEPARPVTSSTEFELHRTRLGSADLLRLGSTLSCLLAHRGEGNPGNWLRGLLHSVRGLIEADKAAIFVWVPGREPVGYGDNVSEVAVTAYIKRFAAIDMARRRAFELGAEVWSVSQLWPQEQLRRSEFYQAFVLPFHLHEAVAISIRVPVKQAEVQLALYQGHPSPPAAASWRQNLLQVILPAVRVAVQAHLTDKTSMADLGSVMDVSGQALALFDLSGRQVRTNPVMQRALAQDPERSRVETSLRQVAAAVVAPLAPDQSGQQGNRSDGRRLEIATSTAAYRLRGNLVGYNALGHPRAIMVSLNRVAFEIPAPDSLRTRYGLTVRELQVASLIMHRLSNTEIARMLGISPHTARHHTENVLAKLGVRSRKALRRLVSGGGPEPAPQAKFDRAT